MPSFETLAGADHEHKVASHQPFYNYYAWSLCHSVYMYSGLIHCGDGDSLGLGYLLGLLGGQVVKVLDYRPRGPRFLPHYSNRNFFTYISLLSSTQLRPKK